MTEAFFIAQGELLLPQSASESRWLEGTVRGPAAVAALARTAEPHGPEGMRPARAVFELFRPVPLKPLRFRAEIVRKGTRICVVDAFLSHDGVDMSRAHILFARPSDEEPRGAIWQPDAGPHAPPADTPTITEGQLYHSATGWTAERRSIHPLARKTVWQYPRTVFEGEEPTPFQQAAYASDVTSLVTHWGTHGLEFINADVTLSLARLPTGAGIGIHAIHVTASEGISSGTATLFDERGDIGSANVVGLANTGRAVAFIRE